VCGRGEGTPRFLCRREQDVAVAAQLLVHAPQGPPVLSASRKGDLFVCPELRGGVAQGVAVLFNCSEHDFLVFFLLKFVSEFRTKTRQRNGAKE